VRLRHGIIGPGMRGTRVALIRGWPAMRILGAAGMRGARGAVPTVLGTFGIFGARGAFGA
jgi:hypothetical protein